MENTKGNDESAQQLAKTVGEIREAEAAGERTLEAARAKAEERITEAKEKSVEFSVKSNQEIVALKNKMLLDGRKEIERDITKITDKAQSEGKKLERESVTTQQAEKIAKKALGM